MIAYDVDCALDSWVIGLFALVGIVAGGLLLAHVRGRWESALESYTNSAFDLVDIDKSGFIDEAELEIAVLTLYEKVAFQVIFLYEWMYTSNAPFVPGEQVRASSAPIAS